MTIEQLGILILIRPLNSQVIVQWSNSQRLKQKNNIEGAKPSSKRVGVVWAHVAHYII